MSNKVCDTRSVVKIIADSAYKAVMFDILPGKAITLLGVSTLHSALIFVGATTGYTIRGLARECGDEYVPSLSGYTQYIGGAIGGAFKYLINGLTSSTSLVKSIILGSINNFCYELMIDAHLNMGTYTFFAAMVEMSEPVLSHMLFVPHDTLRKDMLISVGASLFVSTNAYFIYDNTYHYTDYAAESFYNHTRIDYEANTLYNHIIDYAGHNTTVQHDDL